MLPRPGSEIAIETMVGDHAVGKKNNPSGQIHVKRLMGPCAGQPGARTALLLHGEALGGNHTLVERPGRWLVARDLFDRVILPDRRGNGAPMPRPLTLAEHAADLSSLLDRMDIHAPLAVIGVSSGGPLALTLAASDPRVTYVALVASSAALQPPGALERFLMRRGWLQAWMARDLRRRLANRPLEAASVQGDKKVPMPEADFDPAYDSRTPQEMSAAFNRALQSVPLQQVDALTAAFFATHDPRLASASPDLALPLPIVQVIGRRDELWEQGEVSPTPPADLLGRFPRWRRVVVPSARMHNDVFFQARAFYKALCDALAEHCDLVKKQ